MIKFMRKHNKKLLAIFASGLLVVWLGSTALQEMFRPDTGSKTAGHAFGAEVTRDDVRMALSRIDVLGSLRVFWDRPWGGGMYNLPIKPVDQFTWFLLDLEARRSGIDVPDKEVERFIKASRIHGKWLENIRDQKGISIDRIMACIADYVRIGKVGQLATSAVKVSTPEVMHFIRDTSEKVSVKMALLRASDFADADAKPDAAALEKHFYQYRELLPGEGEHGYGYKWPDRIRVEYLVADVDAIESAMKISHDDAREYWSKNRKNYTKEVPVAGTSHPSTAPKPTTTSRPATASHPTTSTKPATKTVVKSFPEALEQVVADMKAQRAPDTADKIIRMASIRLIELWFDATTDEETGYKIAPPGVDAPDYLEKIAAKVCESNELPPEVLRVVKPGRWLTRKDAAALEGIGQAVVVGQPADEDAAVEFAKLAFRVQNLYTPPERGSGGRGLALYQTLNASLRDTKAGRPHNYYLFRVVAAEPTHVPQTTDGIKDKLRLDVVELAGYQRAGASAKKLLAAARSKGVEAAVKADAALHKRLGESGLAKPEPFARKRNIGQFAMQFDLPLTVVMPIEELGVTEERKLGYFPMPLVAERFEPEVEAFIETCFGLAPAPGAASQPAQRVTLVEMPRSKQWVIVEFLKIDRVPQTDFMKIRSQGQEMLQAYRTIKFLQTWYDPEQVKTRTSYVAAKDEDEE